MKATKLWVRPALYKVLRHDGRAPHVSHDYRWSVPTANADGSWTPGEWHEEEGGAVCEKGLHVTTRPLRWMVTGAAVYEAEVEGLAANPWDFEHNDKFVARRVRLVRRLADGEVAAMMEADRAEKAREQREAEEREAKRKEEHERLEKEERSRRAKQMAELAARQRKELALAREAGVMSPALRAFRLLEQLSPTDSWRDTNASRHEALAYATRWMRFDPEDVAKIYSEFKGGYWFGDAEGHYASAIAAGNKSAMAAWEHFLRREPWIYTDHLGERTRLTVGSWFEWEGERVKVTSFADANTVVACSYHEDDTKPCAACRRYFGSRDKLKRRFKVTREALNGVFGKKKSTPKKPAKKGGAK